MKLGTQTGSLVNHLMSNTVTSEIKAGAPATFLSWTDRHPGTVTKVFSKGAYTYLNVRRDEVKYHEDRSGNFDIVDGNNEYFSTFRFKSDGTSGFQEVTTNPNTGRYVKIKNGGLTVGTREYYYDPHF